MSESPKSPGPSDSDPFNAEGFLAFRKEKVRELNDQVCEAYYQNKLSVGDLQKQLLLSDEEARLFQFVLDSFLLPKTPGKSRRKDGSHIAVHSLQLFLTARDFYQIKEPKILATVLVHDILEDTALTQSDIASRLGQETADLAATMTEERGEGQLPEDRVLEVVNFTQRLRHGGPVPATAEILDREDDISDLTYLFSPLEKEPDNKSVRDQIKEKLIAKFGKCSYTVKKMAEVAGEPAQKIVTDFEKLLNHQLSEISARFGITITQTEIENEVQKYLAREPAR